MRIVFWFDSRVKKKTERPPNSHRQLEPICIWIYMYVSFHTNNKCFQRNFVFVFVFSVYRLKCVHIEMSNILLNAHTSSSIMERKENKKRKEKKRWIQMDKIPSGQITVKKNRSLNKYEQWDSSSMRVRAQTQMRNIFIHVNCEIMFN